MSSRYRENPEFAESRTSSDDDDDAVILEHLHLRRRPAQMDRASWELIKRLHMSAAVDSESVALAMQLQEDEDFSHDMSRRQHEEKQSLEIAKRIQEEDMSRRQLEERQSLELAKSIQEEENLNRTAKPPHSLTREEVLHSLKPCQRAALTYVQRQARKLHSGALPALKIRITKLGFQIEALDRCLEYVREDAPIIIHLKDKALSLLVQDTHYRNLFETKTSGGKNDPQARQKWEERLFGRSYNGCEPSLRPKYGCLNITGDIAGVAPARRYGGMFMTLAPHVRYRATFSDKDTGAAKACTLATNDYYAHILAQYPDVDLCAALSVSRLGGAPSKCGMYKEVQIHGPICLATDVQALSVPGRAEEANPKLKQDVRKFQKITGCNVLWQGDLLGS